MQSLLEAVRRHRIIVGVRGMTPERAVPVARALYEGGIRMVEITFQQGSPTKLVDTAQAIAAVRAEFGDTMLIGAGTVLHVEEAECAYVAGAAYLLSPTLNRSVLACAKELGVGMAPGVFTPTEMVDAYEAGAELVKLFPAAQLGLAYINAVRAPLSHIPILAMGGVSPANLADFLAVAAGVGVGSAIADAKAIAEGDYKELTTRARQFTDRLIPLSEED